MGLEIWHDRVLLCRLVQSLEKTFATGMTPAANCQCSALIDGLVKVQGHVMKMPHSIHDSAASQEGTEVVSMCAQC